ncbi:glycosyl hydrolase family 18 protein [Herbiconiux sp. CPCC 205763]|uniref:Glycosyl hydrolase family 18 protein n=1 Tax=Herbiconiux aconitum TaxID=2970913 RepID=A0ABT2GU75_9MICO|nr:glycosyl hydrolase family 18 protein [Herbiconiux aconitum]MCS5719117.1 glycosyl hydrolase family 18 protein [Herbiconiux aconitum]
MSPPAPTSQPRRAVRTVLMLLVAGSTLLFGGCVSELAAGDSFNPSSRPVPDGGAGTPSPLPTDSRSTHPHTGSSHTDPFGVEGYLLIDEDSARHVTANAGLATMIGVDGVMVDEGGASLIPEPPGSAEVVAEAHALGMHAELLIANYDLETKDFSAEIGAALLGSPTNRTAVIGELVAAVEAGGYDSVQLDLEYLSITDAAGLTAFARELDSALDQVPGHGTESLPDAGTLTATGEIPISIAVMAKASPADYLAAGYDFHGLLATVDRVVLMGYDQHGPSWSEPGPVGGMPWVMSSLDALRASGVPDAKIDLGIGAYGYSWPGDGSPGTTLRVTDARAIAGDHAVFDAEQGEWTATLDDSTVLWWSDETSRDIRMQFAREEGLHGVAIWQLASAE